MKGLKVFTAILVVQVLLIGALLVWPNLPVSKVVKWEAGVSSLQATYVRGGETCKTALNREIADYLAQFEPYYDQDILHFNHIRVVSETTHLSVVEIRTELMHNATAESGGEYVPAGEKTVELWVFADGDSVKTQWVEKENTLEALPNA